MCVHVHVVTGTNCMYMYICVKAMGGCWMPSSVPLYLGFLSQGLSPNLELTDSARAQANELQGSACLCCPSIGMTEMLWCPGFTQVLGIRT